MSQSSMNTSSQLKKSRQQNKKELLKSIKSEDEDDQVFEDDNQNDDDSQEGDDEKYDKMVLDEFKKDEYKNDGKWGAEHVYVVGKKEKTKNYDQEITNINSHIMKYEFIPKNVYVIDIKFTDTNTFLITTNGLLYSWGVKDDVLGRPAKNKDEAMIPKIIQVEKQFVAIATGFNHVLALDINGKVWSWGVNKNGQLGHGQMQKQLLNKDAPLQIKVLQDQDIAQIYAGCNCSFAISKAGTTFAWGDNSQGQLGVPGFSSAVHEPLAADKVPWLRIADTKIVVSKNNRSIVWQHNQQNNEGGTGQDDKMLLWKIKKLEFKIQELQESNKRLAETKDQYEKQLYGGNKNQTFEDKILNEIHDQQQVRKDELNKLQAQDAQFTNIIETLERELQTIKIELEDNAKKELQLFAKKEAHELDVNRKIKSDTTSKKDLDQLKKQQNLLRELALATADVKKIKQNEQSLKMKQLNETGVKQNALRLQLEERQFNYDLYKTLEMERLKNLEQISIQDKLEEIKKVIAKCNTQFKALNESNINEIVKNAVDVKGITEVIKESNNSIMKVKFDIDNEIQKAAFSSCIDQINQITEILKDDISLRLKMNDFIQSGLLQSNLRLQQSLHLSQNDASKIREAQQELIKQDKREASKFRKQLRQLAREKGQLRESEDEDTTEDEDFGMLFVKNNNEFIDPKDAEEAKVRHRKKLIRRGIDPDAPPETFLERLARNIQCLGAKNKQQIQIKEIEEDQINDMDQKPQKKKYREDEKQNLKNKVK